MVQENNVPPLGPAASKFESPFTPRRRSIALHPHGTAPRRRSRNARQPPGPRSPRSGVGSRSPHPARLGRRPRLARSARVHPGDGRAHRAVPADGADPRGRSRDRQDAAEGARLRQAPDVHRERSHGRRCRRGHAASRVGHARHPGSRRLHRPRRADRRPPRAGLRPHARDDQRLGRQPAHGAPRRQARRPRLAPRHAGCPGHRPRLRRTLPRHRPRGARVHRRGVHEHR